MALAFAKMHGIGNDFMVIDGVTQKFSLDAKRIAELGDRHTGIGFDQLLVIEAPSDPDADFRYTIYNTDGTQAEQCGNGSRCIALFALQQQLTKKHTLLWQTKSGRLTTQVESLDPIRVQVEMEVPGFGSRTVPFSEEYADGETLRLEVSGQVFEVHPVSMGNPHGVIFVPQIRELDLTKLGPPLTEHAAFPSQANIEFCEVVDEGFIRLRVHERGTGETLACGSGACAAVVAGIQTGKLANRVKVSLPGGKLRIEWLGPGQPVKMTGAAEVVYQGSLT